MKPSRSSGRHWLAAALLSGLASGCVAPQPPVPTLWQKLGIPQAGARLRDGLINRNGNRPQLEKKPPVLALADPKNLESKNPAIKAAAEIKADEDLKKQKIKAIKYLASVGCGCPSQKEAIEAAFLGALKDCTPEVRQAAVEGLAEAAGTCGVCYDGCAATCCTEAIQKQLADMAFGQEKGCFKEPSAEIRRMAAATLNRCPPLPPKPEEKKEEPKKPAGEGADGLKEVGDEADEKEEIPPVKKDSPETVQRDPEVDASVNILLTAYGEYDAAPVVVYASHAISSRATSYAQASPLSGPISDSKIANPENLVNARTVEMRSAMGELLIELDLSYQLVPGWTMVVVSDAGDFTTGKIANISGKRVLLTLENPSAVSFHPGSRARIGLMGQ